MAKAKQAVKVAPVIKMTPVEEAQENFKNMVSYIVDDYLFDDNAKTELGAAIESLMEVVSSEMDKAENRKMTAADLKDAMDSDDISTEDLLAELDSEQMLGELQGQGYLCMQIPETFKRQQVVDYLKENVFTTYAEQRLAGLDLE